MAANALKTIERVKAIFPLTKVIGPWYLITISF